MLFNYILDCICYVSYARFYRKSLFIYFALLIACYPACIKRSKPIFMIKILIVNDKYGTAVKMRKLIAGTIAEDIEVEILPGIEIARDWLKLHPEPDIILMDVHLRSGVSFDLFRYLKVECPIIFTTENDYVSCLYKMRTSQYMLSLAGEETDEYPVALDESGSYQRQHAANNLLQVITGLKTPSQPSYKEKFIVHVRNNWIPVNTPCTLR